jgi:iron complex outermembrane receptor protein
VLDAADLERTGLATNLLEILQKRMPMVSGSNNLGTTAANTNAAATAGGSQLALRNLSTLVLVNGRRVSDNGIGARGFTGRNFVDISQIPVAAIERVEVLADGASAIYGSDAIGGVVNIILRSDFRGAESGGRYAVSTDDGHYAERSAHLTAGAGNDRVNVTASVSWSKTDPLFQSERRYSRPMLGSSLAVAGAIGQGNAFPTYLLNPALNSPRDRNPTGTSAAATSLAALVANGTYVPATAADVGNTLDTAPYVTVLLGRESRSGYANLDAKLLGQRLELVGDFLFTKNETFSQLAAASFSPNATVPAGAPSNPLTVAFPQVSFRYAPAPRGFNHDDRMTRGTLGLRGQLGEDWRWETSYTRSRNVTQQSIHNVFYAPNVARAIAGGYNAQGVPTPGGAFSRVITGFSEERGTFVIQPALDPFARPAGVDPASLNNLLGTVYGKFTATLDQANATLSGIAWRWPAGKARFAVGADVRREELAGMPDENSRNTGPTARRWLGAPLLDPFAHARRIESGYGELRVPLAGGEWTPTGLHALETDVAWRVENYSDAGRSRAPKYGLRWQPRDGQLTLRATYSESFQAPTQFSLYGPVTQNFTTTGVIPGVFGVIGQAQQLTGSNPALRPSRARSRSVGVVWAPRALQGFTGGVDFVAVNQVDLAGSIGAAAILQDVDARGPASPFASQVAFFNFPGRAGATPITAPGQLRDWLVTRGNTAQSIFLVDAQDNIAGQRLRALDVHAGYHAADAGWGAWDVRTTGTFFLSYQFQTTPLEPYFEYAGAATRGGTGSVGTIPPYRFYNTIAWQKNSWCVTLGHTYVPPVVDLATGGLTFVNASAAGVRARVPVSGFSAFDLAASYTVKKNSGVSALRRWLGGTTLTAGVNNLTNRPPPLAPQAFDDNRADVAAYDPIGRLWYVSVKAEF